MTVATESASSVLIHDPTNTNTNTSTSTSTSAQLNLTVDVQVFIARGESDASVELQLPTWMQVTSATVTVIGVNVVGIANSQLAHSRGTNISTIEVGSLTNVAGVEVGVLPPMISQTDAVVIRLHLTHLSNMSESLEQFTMRASLVTLNTTVASSTSIKLVAPEIVGATNESASSSEFHESVAFIAIVCGAAFLVLVVIAAVLIVRKRRRGGQSKRPALHLLRLKGHSQSTTMNSVQTLTPEQFEYEHKVFQLGSSQNSNQSQIISRTSMMEDEPRTSFESQGPEFTLEDKNANFRVASVKRKNPVYAQSTYLENVVIYAGENAVIAEDSTDGIDEDVTQQPQLRPRPVTDDKKVREVNSASRAKRYR
jgi:hypothetical protein